MFVKSQSFYWDCAKFAFSLIGGGTAGYCLVKGINTVMTKAAVVGEMKVAQKMMASSDEKSDVADNGDDICTV